MIDNDELLENWPGLAIKDILRLSEKYIVFINEKDEFDWKFDDDIAFKNDDFDKERYGQLFSKFSELEIEEEILDNKNQIFRFRQLLANIFVNIVETDYDSAEFAIKNAKEFVVQKNLETTRILSLITILSSSIVIFIIAFILSSFEFAELFSVFCKSLFSVVGIAICSFFSTRKKVVFIETGKCKIIIESIARVIVGIFCGFMGLLCFRAKIIFPQLYDVEIEHIEILVVILCASSESFFPNILGKLDKEISA